MKRRLYLIILLAAIAFSGMAQTVGEAFYIYRNDGGFNAFFRDEVQSIEYSNYDDDGNYYDEIVTQIVNTADSVYKIPLAAIDSVGFSAPEKKYAPSVKVLNELIPYITEVDGMTFRLSANTPSELIPLKDDVLLCEDFENEFFPTGFAGRVTTTGNVIQCDSVGLDEIYEQLICVGAFTVTGDDDVSGNSRSQAPTNIHLSRPFKFSWALESPDNNIKCSGNLSIQGQYNLDIKVVCKITKDEPFFFDVQFSETKSLGIGVGIEGNASVDLCKNLKPKDFFMTPIPNTPFLFKMKERPSLKLEGTVSLNYSTEGTEKRSWGLKYENGHPHAYSSEKEKTGTPPHLSGDLSGRIFAGILLEYGIYSYGEIISSYTEQESGAELYGEMSFSPDDCTYDNLRNSQFGLNFLIDAKEIFRLKLLEWLNFSQELPLFSCKWNIGEWKLLPGFSAPQIDMTDLTKATISVVPEDKLLPPGVTIGLGVWDEAGEKVNISSCPEKYREINEWPLEKYQNTFEGLKPGVEYETAPVVWWAGLEMKASPSTTFTTVPPLPAEIIKFGQDGASYNKDGFEYKDKIYHYDFACSTTVILENTEGVEDWGYIYKDEEGDTTRISVKGLGSNPYTDSRYHYYRNEPKSSAMLYGYTQYVGGKICYKESKSYPLVYTHKPSAYVKDAFNVTSSSAQFEYGFNDVPQAGKCYITIQAENESDINTHSVSVTDKDTFTASNLLPGTTYTYWSYVEYEGKTYADSNGKKTFTTKYEIPDISGTWNCKEYQDGAQTGEVTLQLNANGTVTRSGISGSASGGNDPGRWSINADGKVYIYFEYVTYSGASEKSYSGTINSFVNPSQIEGISTYRYTGNMGGGSVKQYDFVMTR